MITAFAVTNFKNLASIPGTEGELLPFGPLNVLIGPNGCGKSSLLQAVDFLRAFFRSSVEVYLQEKTWDYRDLPNLRQTSKVMRWELKAELDADKDDRWAGEYHYSVTLKPRKNLEVSKEFLRWRPRGGSADAWQQLIQQDKLWWNYWDESHLSYFRRQHLSIPASIISTWNSPRERERFPQALHFRNWVENFRSFLIWDPKVLRSPSRGRHDQLGPSGEHLASVIGRLKEANRPAFQRLVRRIRRLFPMISDISVTGRGWGWRDLSLHEANGKDVVFNSRQMSDGILRVLAVTSLLYLDHIPPVITFEEPENGVHPQLLREIVQSLRELTQRKPPNRCQVFLTTHSPYVLDEFFDHPEEVYCMERPTPQAGARVIRLSDNRQLKLASEHFNKSLGEAWVSGLLGAAAGRGDA